MDLVSILVNPLVEIVGSLLLGALMGWLLTLLETLFHSNTNRLNMTIAFVFLTASLAMLEFEVGPVTVGFSSLLVCMMLGTVFCNLCPLSEDLMGAADKWTSPLFALFFVISGAELELSVFTDIAIVCIGVVYIAFRSAGKYIGAYISAKGTRCAPQICKYLGITLLPQAGVALGMCTTAMQLGEQGGLIRNITLFSVLVYELVGPLLTRQALTAAGDIRPMSDEVRQPPPGQAGRGQKERQITKTPGAPTVLQKRDRGGCPQGRSKTSGTWTRSVCPLSFFPGLSMLDFFPHICYNPSSSPLGVFKPSE